MADRPEEDPVAFTVFNEIGIIDQLATALLERHLPPGLTVPQFIVLNHFVRLGGERSPLELARAFQVTKGAMTNTLKRLEAAGFIDMREDPEDGRRKIVTITEAGRAARHRSVAGLAPVVAEMKRHFPDRALSDLLPGLQAIRRYLDENRTLGQGGDSAG